MDNGVAWQAALHGATQPTLRVLSSAGHGGQITHAPKIARMITHWISRQSDLPRN
jgi:hypothetical protein